ncbi:hypothetical protein STEG23_000538, partial [Scotinomys teguina]
VWLASCHSGGSNLHDGLRLHLPALCSQVKSRVSPEIPGVQELRQEDCHKLKIRLNYMNQSSNDQSDSIVIPIFRLSNRGLKRTNHIVEIEFCRGENSIQKRKERITSGQRKHGGFYNDFMAIICFPSSRNYHELFHDTRVNFGPKFSLFV